VVDNRMGKFQTILFCIKDVVYQGTAPTIVAMVGALTPMNESTILKHAAPLPERRNSILVGFPCNCCYAREYKFDIFVSLGWLAF
jgi:hypothetical protein